MLIATNIAQADPIKISPLTQITPDAVGLIPAEVAELPFDFWKTTPSAQARAALNANIAHRIPALRAFILRISLAELAAPIAPPTASDFVVARIDYLLDRGALDQANALLDKIGTPNSALFARWFDTKLLLRRMKEACAPLIEDLYLAQNKQQQIYCLAQNNRWFDASLILDGAVALGEISSDNQALLMAYLDSESTELGEIIPPNGENRVLHYILLEALGLPVGQMMGADLRFAHEQLGDQFGWKSQIIAGERLAREGAIPVQVLSQIYTRARPAASGGVWERVRLWQDLNQALLHSESQNLCPILRQAWNLFQDLRLEGAFARFFAQRLALHDLAAQCINAQINTHIFHPNYAALLFDLPLSLPHSDPRRELIQTGQITTQTDDPFIMAISQGFARDIAPSADSGALLFALARIDTGIDARPHDIKTALQMLRASGQDNLARQVGLQLLAMYMRRS